jgi:hypothetical protein
LAASDDSLVRPILRAPRVTALVRNFAFMFLEQLQHRHESEDRRVIAGERGRQDLDGNHALQVRVDGAVNLAHPAGAEQRHDSIGA